MNLFYDVDDHYDSLIVITGTINNRLWTNEEFLSRSNII